MKYKIFTSLILVLLLSACSNPLPEDRLDYVGEWRSKEMYLLILQDGTVAYERKQNGGTTTVNAPLKEFIGDDFVVGIGFLKTTFEVSEPPTEINGTWQMVVDGIRLVRTVE
jgi:hypothetical protein